MLHFPTNETAALHQSKGGAGAWWMLAVLVVLYMTSIVDRYIVYMLAPQMQQSFALSDAQVGLIIGPAFSVCFAAFGIPFGWAADRFPRRIVIFVGAIIFGCASLGSAAAAGFLTLFLARAFVGVGEAALSPSAYSLMGDRFPRERLATASAIYVSGANFGHAVAYALGGLAIAIASHSHFTAFAHIEPWRLVLVCAGLPALLFAFAVFTFREPSRTSIGRPKTEVSVLDFLKRDGRVIVPLLICFALSGIYGTAMVAWTPTYLSRHFGLSPAYYGTILGAIGLASGASVVVKGVIVDWFYRRGVKDIHLRFYTWLLTLSLPLAIAMWLVESATAFLAIYGFLQIVTLTMLAYIAPAVQLLTPPELRGRIMSVFLVMFSVVGVALGPPLVGLLTDHVFHDQAMVGYSVLTVMTIIMPITAVILATTLKHIRATIQALEAQ